MTTLTSRQQDKIYLVAYATVSHFFAMFHNPRMRGPNFSWDNFPNMMKEMVAVQVYSANIVSPTHIPIAEAQARKVGFQIAENMVGWMMEE